LKANIAQRATDKRKTSGQGIVINGPVNGGIVNSGAIKPLII
jgi:hypothetical protein